MRGHVFPFGSSNANAGSKRPLTPPSTPPKGGKGQRKGRRESGRGYVWRR